MAKGWTNSEIRKLENLYQSGFKFEEIAERLGRGGDTRRMKINVINAALERYGIRTFHGERHRPWSTEEKEELERLYRDGVPLLMIAHKLGRNTVSNISYALDTHGIRDRAGYRQTDKRRKA